jgi:DNA-binding NarL/FixJ family response regulator
VVEHIDPMTRPRVILVDDDPHVRRALRRALVAEGVLVVGEAGDGADAASEARHQRADLVVMDLSMRRLSGIDATQLLAQALPDTKVVLLTAYHDLELVEAAQEAGISAYLVKGCPVGDIVHTINRVWDERAASASAGAVRPPAG